MVVPIRVKQLHESRAALGETAGEDAIGGVAARAARIGAVEFEGGLRLVPEVGQFWDARLHAKRHFVLLDTGLDFGVALILEMQRIERIQSIELASANGSRQAFWVAEIESGIRSEERRVG